MFSKLGINEFRVCMDQEKLEKSVDFPCLEKSIFKKKLLNLRKKETGKNDA